MHPDLMPDQWARWQEAQREMHEWLQQLIDDYMDEVMAQDVRRYGLQCVVGPAAAVERRFGLPAGSLAWDTVTKPTEADEPFVVG